tara:strand:+ start:480 stop:890 length:411 start_codon:yes stop_codon:yes gene_type:complete
MGYKMQPGKGESARSTGKGMQMRGLVNPASPLTMHDGTGHPSSEAEPTLGREGEFVGTKYAGGSDNVTFDPKTGYKKGEVKIDREDITRPIMDGKEYNITDPRQKSQMKSDSLKLTRKYDLEAKRANEYSGITNPQ